MQAQTGINVNLRDLYEMTNKNIPVMDDIEEDEKDRFITKQDGTLRTKIFSGHHDDDWVEDLNKAGSVTGGLIRKKRCGGGNNNDNGNGNANRARRTKRVRKNNNLSPGGTMKTIKVIQNGQVISHSVEYSGSPTATVSYQIPLVQPAVHTIQHPTVQHQQVVSTTQPQLIQSAPGVQPVFIQPGVQQYQLPVAQPLIQ